MNSSVSPASQLTVSRLTASGRGAVAVIRVNAASPADAHLLDNLFQSASGIRLTGAEIDRICYGNWRDEDVVAVRTAKATWEIHCHGGEAAVRRILADLGGLPESPPIDPLSGLLLQCRTLRTADFLLAQQQGLLHEFVNRVCDVASAAETKRMVQEFLRWERFATHLTSPWTVVIAGRPNAGKSSLLNAVLGYERTIVFDQPGTTRDRIEAEVIIDGWPFRFTDTAGVRSDPGDEIESLGVAAARDSITTSDACLLVVDSVEGWCAENQALLAQVPSACPVIIAWNKCDDARSIAPAGLPIRSIETSALTGAGVQEILQALSALLIPAVPDTRQPLPVLTEMNFSLRQFLQNQDTASLQSWLQKLPARDLP